MKHFHTFQAGINQKNSPINQPQGSYRWAKNMNRRSDGTLFNEVGHKALTQITPGMKIIGSTVLENQTILFLTNNENSEIGVLDEKDVYIPLLNNTLLNFKDYAQVDCQARKDFLGRRIIYFVDSLNPIRRINLDNIPTVDFEESIKLILSYTIPDLTPQSPIQGGNLPTGIYQFSVRYLTEEGNSTPFSPLTGVVPIIDESDSVIRNNDGAFPGTSSPYAIPLDISGIDPKYKSIEIAVLTYTGIENTLTISLLKPIKVESSQRQFLITDIDSQKSGNIPLEEFLLEQVNYNSARHVEQKDGTLLISHLTEKDSGIDFQSIANGIEVFYTIEEKLFYEDLQVRTKNLANTEASDFNIEVIQNLTADDYKNPLNTTFKKGYRRGETYSFAFVPIFKDGRIGNAYHIPGNYNNLNVDTITKRLGGTRTTATYPTNKGLPQEDGVGTTRVRHHRMPTLEQEPMFTQEGTLKTGVPTPQGDLQTHNIINSYVIRILGVEMKNIVIPSSVKSQLSGYIIVRQPRVGFDKNYLQQGLWLPMHRTMNFTNNQQTQFPVLDQVWSHSLLNGDVGYSGNSQFGTDSGGGGTSNTGTSLKGNDHISDNMGAFYSAESVITQSNPLEGGDCFIQAEMLLVGQAKLLKERMDSSSNPGPNNTWNMLFNGERLEPLQVNGSPRNTRINRSFFLDRDTLEIDGDIYKRKDRPVINKPDFPNNYQRFSNSNHRGAWVTYSNNPLNYTVKNSYLNTGIGVLPGQLNDTNFPIKPQFIFDYQNGGGGNRLYAILSNGQWKTTHWGTYDDSVGSNPNVFRFRNVLYNIVRYNQSQYGELSDAQYIPCQVKLFDGNDQTIRLYGGDTFISKWSFMTGSIVSGPAQPNGNTMDEGWMLNNNLFHLFTESEINPNYRHSSEGTLTYFPKESKVWSADGTGLLNTLASTGQGGREYNKQYSFENSVQRYLPAHLSIVGTGINTFDNLTIYSDQSIEGELFDAYRVFRPNNRHFIPKNKGGISDTFVFNDVFYIATPYTIYRTYFNQETAVQSTDGRSIILGTGGRFPIPSKELFTVQGGYGGTKSKQSLVVTPFGVFYVDEIQNKVFFLTGELTEISDQGLTGYFQKNIFLTPDNPSNDYGYTAFYDYQTKRYLLTKLLSPLPIDTINYLGEYNDDLLLTPGQSIVFKDGKLKRYQGNIIEGSETIKVFSDLQVNEMVGNNWTLSYHPQLQSWTSEHGYYPNHSWTKGDRIFLHKNEENIIYEGNAGDRGQYFNQVKENSELEIVTNPEPSIQKVFENNTFITTTEKDGIVVTEDCFTKMDSWNMERRTGLKSLVFDKQSLPNPLPNTVRIKLKNNEYRVAVPKNEVVDVTQSIWDNNNLSSNLPVGDTRKLFRPNLKGKYIQTRLIYENKEDKEFNVNVIITDYRPVAG